jgi:MerR family transcriptional regulator, light-induced transcriptional regulator
MPSSEDYLNALLRGDREAAFRVAREAVAQGLDVTEVHLHLLQPALVRIGELWRARRLSVAAEHVATAITQYVVVQLYPYMRRVPERRGRALLAGVAGEHHQLGGHMVADALEADGWEVCFLGSDCSVDRVLAQVQAFGPALVGLSCTMRPQCVEVARVARGLRGLLPDGRPALMVGGQAFAGHEGAALAASLGADALARDLRQAVLTARALRPWVGAVA